MFGHKSLPTIIFAYGAKEPMQGLEIVIQQMKAAHDCRNAMVAIEQERRKMVDAALQKLSPELAEIEMRIVHLEEKVIEDARDEIRKASQKARTNVRPPEFVEIIQKAAAEIKTLRPKRKELRDKLFGKWNKESKNYEIPPDPRWQVADLEIEAWVRSQLQPLYNNRKFHWSTYNHLMTTVKRSGAEPNFHKFDGSGHLVMQIQNGMSAAEAFSGEDRRLVIESHPKGVWVDGTRRPRKLGTAIAHFRVDSTEKTEDQKGGQPVWAVVPFVMHRPIPEDAAIKFVHLIRRRIGTHSKWEIQFMLSRASGWAKPDRAQDGAVGIDIGWRLMEDGSLRVAYWKGSDDAEGELRLPPHWLPELSKTEDIRSIRDEKLFDPIRPWFAEELKKLEAAHPGEKEEWSKKAEELKDPEELSAFIKTNPVAWLLCATENLIQWKSQGRLAGVVIRWRENRFPGDEGLFNVLEEAWRKRDKHLYEYERNLADQLQNFRANLYRNFAAQMRRKYRLAVIEDIDLRKFHRLPNPEETPDEKAVREHIRDGCIHFLRQCLKESMTETKKVPAMDTTTIHSTCGSKQYWDRMQLMHTCTECGETYDQDRNAAINLLGMAELPAVTE